VRWTGNDADLIELARKNAVALSCGHCFIIFVSGGFPVNILNTIKAVPEVCNIYCATANPVEVIVAETGGGRGILGVIDGMKSQGVEAEPDIEARKKMLRKFGYKLG
jgi:adenosine/AMP kinase